MSTPVSPYHPPTNPPGMGLRNAALRSGGDKSEGAMRSSTRTLPLALAVVTASSRGTDDDDVRAALFSSAVGSLHATRIAATKARTTHRHAARTIVGYL